MNNFSHASSVLLSNKGILVGVSIISMADLITGSAIAQSISIDNSTPTILSGPTNCVSGDCTITGGTSIGNNLFHSFSRFNVDPNATVTFTPAGTVSNIFGRITDINSNNISNIDGTLAVTGNANLFLLNSNGIVFGNDATINIGGSFLASTAESLLFENDQQFNTTNTDVPSILTISTPIGLQFGSTPQPISVGTSTNASTSITAGSNRNLALLGGEVTLNSSNLNSIDGHIEIGSVGSSNRVDVDTSLTRWDFDYGQVTDFQDISILQGSSVSVNGNDAGRIRLQGKTIEIDSSNLSAGVFSSGDGEITINASESLQIDTSPTTITTTPSTVSVSVQPGANGTGTSLLQVNAPEIMMSAGAQITMLMAGDGQAGQVDISSERIQISGESTGARARPTTIATGVVFGNPNTPGTGDGGTLNIHTQTLTVESGAQIAARTDSLGNGGTLNINGGVQTINGETVTLPAAEINVSGFGQRTPSLILSASGIPPSQVTGLTQLPNGSGNSGDINIVTTQLFTDNGGQIVTGTNANRDAGTLSINASESVTLSGQVQGLGRSGLLANALFGSGAGGDIQVTTPQLSVLNGATINTSNFASNRDPRRTGSGAAGDITLNATNVLASDESLITAETVSGGNDANININTPDGSVVLRRGSDITASASGSTTGGNITIDTEALIALEDSDITANSSLGPGGRVVVTANTILGTEFREQLTSESDITATSDLGPEFNGTVELNTPDIDPTDGVENLPEGLSSDDQIVAACEQLQQNTFVATGRGGIPADASQLITGQSIWNDFRSLEAPSGFPQNKSEEETKPHVNSSVGMAITDTHTSIVEAETWSRNSNGDIVLGMNNTHPVSLQLSAGCLSEQTLS